VRDIYRYGDNAVPVPLALAAYVRGPQHMADLLSAVCKRVGTTGRQRSDYAACIAVLRAAATSIKSAQFANALLAVFDITTCQECNRPFLGDGRYRYCSEDCHRSYWNTHQRPAPKETPHE